MLLLLVLLLLLLLFCNGHFIATSTHNNLYGTNQGRKSDKQAISPTFYLLWNSGVDFINILHAAFTLVDPESIENTVNSSVPFNTFGICER